MTKHKTVFAPISLLLVLVFHTFAAARAQAPMPRFAWQHQFAQAIDWYIRTSAGILLVRSGQTLTAIDGTDGKVLWELPYVAQPKIESVVPGVDIVEVPDLSIVLLNRTKLSSRDQPHLVGVDLWTGKILWQQPELDSLLQLVPMQDSGRVLLLGYKDPDARKSAIAAAGLAPYAGLAAEVILQVTIPVRIEMTLLDPRTGHAEWASEYPRSLMPRHIEVRENGSQLYLFEYDEHHFSVLARIDPSNGQTLWEYRVAADFGTVASAALEFVGNDFRLSIVRKVPPSVQFVGDQAIFAIRGRSGGEDLTDLDLSTQKPVWTISDVGKIRVLVADQDLILGAGGIGAFGIAAKSGVVRWNIKTHGAATNFLFDKDENALILCDDKKFMELDAATGKILREAPHQAGSEPRFIRRAGPELIVVAGKNDATVVNTATGEASAPFPKPDLEFSSASFWVGSGNVVGLSDPPVDLARELQDRWPELSSEAGQDQGLLEAHARIESFLNSDAGPLYANRIEDSGDSGNSGNSGNSGWRFRQVDPNTGAMQVFDLKGDEPDANPALGLVYLIENQNDLLADQVPAK
jgi:outer membrane protein assembly factor BamB